jgi:hypothetical protein
VKGAERATRCGAILVTEVIMSPLAARRHTGTQGHQAEVPTNMRRIDMDMRQYSSSRFIGVEDLRGGPRHETFVSVEPGKYDKPVATFESGDQLTLNKTNVRTLIDAYGAGSRDWTGCTIELSIGTAKYNGDQIESVLVKPISPPKPREAPTPAPKSPAPDDDRPF